MKSEIEKFVLQHATLTRRYFLGCGVAGIAAAGTLPMRFRNHRPHAKGRSDSRDESARRR